MEDKKLSKSQHEFIIIECEKFETFLNSNYINCRFSVHCLNNCKSPVIKIIKHAQRFYYEKTQVFVDEFWWNFNNYPHFSLKGKGRWNGDLYENPYILIDIKLFLKELCKSEELIDYFN